MVCNIIEIKLKISTRDICLHAVRRVGKPAAQNDDNSSSTRPRPIIARFVSRERTEQVLGVIIDLRNPTDTRLCSLPEKRVAMQK